MQAVFFGGVYYPLMVKDRGIRRLVHAEYDRGIELPEGSSTVQLQQDLRRYCIYSDGGCSTRGALLSLCQRGCHKMSE